MSEKTFTCIIHYMQLHCNEVQYHAHVYDSIIYYNYTQPPAPLGEGYKEITTGLGVFCGKFFFSLPIITY